MAAFDPFGLQSETEEKVAATPLLNDSPKADLSAFDPFGISADGEDDDDARSNESPKAPPTVSRITSASKGSGGGGGGLTLPPKLNVKLTINEEVSSFALPDQEGASEVSVDGNILAQVQCSDAMKNAPFSMIVSTASGAGTELSVRPNPSFTTTVAASTERSKKTTSNTAAHLVKIPKHEIGFVPVAYYSVSNQIQHMPLLLERKVTTSGKSCRIAVQVRSKLSNRGNLQDFVIAVAVPESVDGESIHIVRGDGIWDELKRTIKWKLSELTKGESFMVSAQAKLWETPTSTSDEPEIHFPVMLRCSSSADQISDVKFKVSPAKGHPSSVTCITTTTFRLLHRLK